MPVLTLSPPGVGGFRPRPPPRLLTLNLSLPLWFLRENWLSTSVQQKRTHSAHLCHRLCWLLGGVAFWWLLGMVERPTEHLDDKDERGAELVQASLRTADGCTRPLRVVPMAPLLTDSFSDIFQGHRSYPHRLRSHLRYPSSCK